MYVVSIKNTDTGAMWYFKNYAGPNKPCWRTKDIAEAALCKSFESADTLAAALFAMPIHDGYEFSVLPEELAPELLNA